MLRKSTHKTAEKARRKQFVSNSNFNFSTNPGWSTEDTKILKQLLMIHGIGNWTKILKE